MAGPLSRTRITGMADLTHLFKVLPDRIDTKVVRAISRRGARVVVKAARDDAPVGESGNLKRSIQTIVPKERKDAYMLVGAKARKGGGPRAKGFHADLVAKGIYGKGRGKAYGNWIGKAAEKNRTQVFAEMDRAAVPLIEREMNKLASRR